MLRLYSDTHDVATLHHTLQHRLGQPLGARSPQPASVPVNRLPRGTRLRQYLRRIPGLRRAYRLLYAPWLLRHRLYALQQQADATQQRMNRLENQLRAAQQQQRRLQRLELDQRFLRQDIMHRLDRPLAEQTPSREPLTTQEPREHAHWYLAFEANYRGTPNDIEQRQRAYLPFVQAAIPDPNSGLVLDLGCGRGEWLNVLRQEGYQTLGVDSNPAMLQAARDQGLNVQQADLLEGLRLCDASSIAVLSAFQVVEHLPLAVVLEVFSEARRVMRPGGVLLLETPNPENLQVSSYSFWLDPTHQHPLPPPLLANLAQYFGFIDIHIERVSPWPQPPPAPPAEALPQAQRLHQLLYCEQDYALIARQPLEQNSA